ncbi:hypothetical protein [Neokomagataea thailandica]|uniref:Uncharacterized protein n=1 Tax=Neokomagataea tanensis NBRC 106556 TaxID=1223519 RepID=A0ABQ0QJZ5_9PROT|nr:MULTISPECIES: hypothetical protein [Neokomagataea]GBR47526.1 hypothetical protein AA106556_1481 [Neokomagataea tanensis NBRC 106556]
MRRAALLAVPLVLSGCSGLGKYFHDTLFWPGYTPNQPLGNSENLLKIRGDNVIPPAILPTTGNIWPAAPHPLPTLQDAANPNSSFNRTLKDPATYLGSDSLGIDTSLPRQPLGAQVKSGSSLSIGEDTSIHNGVTIDQSHVQALPSSVPDSAKTYLQRDTKRSIIIPNGNGTSTIIDSDGSTRTVKD